MDRFAARYNGTLALQPTAQIPMVAENGYPRQLERPVNRARLNSSHCEEGSIYDLVKESCRRIEVLKADGHQFPLSTGGYRYDSESIHARQVYNNNYCGLR